MGDSGAGAGLNDTIVFDNGTSTIKVGYAGQNQPRFIVPNVVGTPKPGSLMVGIQNKEYFVGQEALAKEKLLDLVNPIKNGMVDNWQCMEELWQHIFVNELHVDSENFHVVMGEKPLTSAQNREKMIQVFFETFNVSGFFYCEQAVLALFSSGRTTGIVLDAGSGLQRCVPVYEGYTIPHAVIVSDLSGSILTDFMSKVLQERNPAMADVPRPCIRAVKERLCYVPLDFQAEVQAPEQRGSMKMPNGQFMECGNERFRCPELLFDPSMNEMSCEGIHQSLFNSIMRCDIDIRKDLYKNIVLCGGTSMFQGFSERIEKEVIALAPPSMKVRVFAPPERRNSVWLGGSVLGAQEFFKERMAVSKSEYKEQGVQIVHWKCHS
jgi:actin-related protein